MAKLSKAGLSGCWRSSENVEIWTLRRPGTLTRDPSATRKPVEWVGPAILMTANEATAPAGWLSLARGCDRSRTLMRHARLTLPLPIGLLALAVILLAYRGGLVP